LATSTPAAALHDKPFCALRLIIRVP